MRLLFAALALVACRNSPPQPATVMPVQSDDPAYHEFLERMGPDPQTLQTSFEKSSGGFGLGSRKGKLWEAFVAHYEKLSQEARADIQKVVGRDFMEAYQAQLRRLKTDR